MDGYTTSILWCRSHIRVNWEGCNRKGIKSDHCLSAHLQYIIPAILSAGMLATELKTALADGGRVRAVPKNPEQLFWCPGLLGLFWRQGHKTTLLLINALL